MSCADAPPRDGAPPERILQVLARHPDGLSLPRLCKRLGLRRSVLLRELAWLGADTIGAVEGPGLVRVEQRGELAIAVLTDAGRLRAGDHAASREHPQPADA